MARRVLLAELVRTTRLSIRLCAYASIPKNRKRGDERKREREKKIEIERERDKERKK